MDEKIILEKKTETISSKDRKEIMDKAISMKKKILIFDDGLQDKKISYDIEFVCFDQKNWLGNGLLLPSGPLREKIKSLKKYSCVFLKKNGEDISNKIQLIKNINSKKLLSIFSKVSFVLDTISKSNEPTVEAFE